MRMGPLRRRRLRALSAAIDEQLTVVRERRSERDRYHERVRAEGFAAVDAAALDAQDRYVAALDALDDFRDAFYRVATRRLWWRP